MNKYWYDYLLEDERKYEDDKATVYDTDCLNDLASWKIISWDLMSLRLEY